MPHQAHRPDAPPSRVADRLRHFGATVFAEMTALADRHNAVNLGQGFPDGPGPALAHAAAADAMRNGHNQYAPMPGLPQLRRAVADRRTRAIPGAHRPDPDREVTITSGATEAIAAAMLGLVNPGDEVVLFEPYYDSYRAAAAMAGATPRFVTLRPREGRFSFDPDELKAAFNDRTRMALINTPHNPTGTVFSPQELGQVADLCRRFDALVLSDEVYERLTYDPAQPHASIADLPGMRERTIVVSSLGKSFSLTGWKVGWAVAPPHLTAGVRAAHQFLTFSVPTPLQHAAAVLLDTGDDTADRIHAHHRAMRDRIVPALRDLGFEVFEPAGTYFVMCAHRAVSARVGVRGDVELCRWLTTHAGVAAIPPSAFYSDTTEPGESTAYLRFAFCKREATIDEAVRRLRDALR